MSTVALTYQLDKELLLKLPAREHKDYFFREVMHMMVYEEAETLMITIQKVEKENPGS